MLKKISCSKIIDSPLVFKKGLNTVVGADDASNSIGKSSILMIIDFAFAGDDFLTKCDDIINNVGKIELEIEFLFDQKYSFKRNTSEPNTILYIEKDEVITLDTYRSFLQHKYHLEENNLTFRGCVNAFFRISQKGNYNIKEPLHNYPKETWKEIRKRILRFFQKYSLIETLEQNIKDKKEENKNIEGAYKSGAIKKITKTTFKKNNDDLENLKLSLLSLENMIKNNFLDIPNIIGNKNLNNYKRSQELQKSKSLILTQLERSKKNLDYLPSRIKKNFSTLLDLFPDINQQKLSEINEFHYGITQLMKNKIKEEKEALTAELNNLDLEIKKLNQEINFLNNNDEIKVFLNEYTENKKLFDIKIKENQFWLKKSEIHNEILDLQKKLNSSLEDSFKYIESTINNEIRTLISKIYTENDISPRLEFSNTGYSFDPGDDRSTGKEYANLIAIDLAFLTKTCLPCVIHDSLVFKNISTEAIQNIIDIYSTYNKQIFISIDEIPKYDQKTIRIIEEAKFLKLDNSRLAFNLPWNKINI